MKRVLAGVLTLVMLLCCMPLSERTYECESCGSKMDRDLNAALNLKQYAIKSMQVN